MQPKILLLCLLFILNHFGVPFQINKPNLTNAPGYIKGDRRDNQALVIDQKRYEYLSILTVNRI